MKIRGPTNLCWSNHAIATQLLHRAFWMRKMKRLKQGEKGFEGVYGIDVPRSKHSWSSLTSDAAINNPQKALNKESISLLEILTLNAATGYHELSVIFWSGRSLPFRRQRKARLGCVRDGLPTESETVLDV